jgi:ankyrin repeat protein
MLERYVLVLVSLLIICTAQSLECVALLMEPKTAFDLKPIGDASDGKRLRSSCSPRLSGAEEPTNKRPRRRESSVAVAEGRQITRLVENNVANDQSQVHYGDRYGEVHHHYHQGHEPQMRGRRKGPHSLDEAKSEGKASEYIARVMRDLSFGRMGLRKGTITPALVNTCQWLSTSPEYISWRDPDRMSEHHGFMWIKSKPGAGKSTLMKFLLESTQDHYPDDKVISFFFNARGDADEKSLIGLYRHLLYQLLYLVPRLIPSLVDDINRLASQGWQLSPLKNIFRTAVLDLQSERLTCFIDALDESSEDEIQDLIDYFEELGNVILARGISLRVCFSSRHYPHVELEECQYLNLDDKHEHQQDIALYVQAKLKLRRGRIPDEIMSSILQRAQGVFLWVVLVTQILKRDYQRGNVHKLRDHLKSLPDGLHNLFNEMIHRDLNNSEDNKNLITILQRIAFAGMPLTPQELYFAVRSEHPDFNISQGWNSDGDDFETMKLFILNCSRGLVELTTNNQRTTVQFIHESVRDYLDDTGFQILTLKRGKAIIGSAHDHLKHCCLRWISSSVLEQACAGLGIEASIMMSDAIRAHEPEFEVVTFLTYAVAQVVRHAEIACVFGVPQHDFMQSFPVKLWHDLARLVGGWPSYSPDPTSLTEILTCKNACRLLDIELKRSNGHLLASQYKSALSFAADRRNWTSLQVLLSSGAPSNRSLKQKTWTLDLVARTRNIDALKLMFMNDTHDIPLRSPVTVLMRAAKSDDWDVAKVLLDHAEIPKEPDAEIKSAIQLLFSSACICGAWPTVNFCLKKTANPNGLIHGEKAAVKACVPKNGNPSNHVRCRPIFRAVSAEGHNEILQLLFDHGADPDVGQGRHYHDAVLEASLVGRHDIVNTLLLSRGNVTQQSRCYYWSVMEDLTLQRRGNVMCTLLDNVHCFRAQEREVYAESLRLATARGFDEIVQILRDRGVTLPEETLSTIDCRPHDAWIKTLPKDFYIRDSMAELSILTESVEDEMV